MKDLSDLVEELGSNGLETVRARVNGSAVVEAPRESRAWRPSPTNRPPYTEAVITIDGVRLGSPGNLTLVVSSPGTGKSNVVTAGMAAAIATRAGKGIDSLGLEVKAARVVYIDTERDRADHWDAYDQMKRRAGVRSDEELPDGFDFVLFTEIAAVKDRRDELESIIEARPDLLIIDGLGDFVPSVNDEEACSEFLGWLRAKAGEHRIALLATLHDNPTPGTSKARGHMGSEAMRRAESVLYLQRDEETGIRTLTTRFAHGKNRSGSDRVETSFVWDDEKKMHLTCDVPVPMTGKKLKLVELADAVYGASTISLRYMDLVSRIIEEGGVKERTAKTRITEMADAGLILPDKGDYYRVRPDPGAAEVQAV